MTETEAKEALQRRLAAFEHGEFAHNARALFGVLGYRSEKRIDLSPNTAGEFRATFDAAGRLNPLTALLDQWQSVDVLFQLTDEELRGAAGEQLAFVAMASPIDNAIIQSYLFIAIALERERYTRTQLAGITREVNKLFPMPVLILFRHGQSLTFAVINRRLNKKDADRDVLEKVTLIKDIAFAQPHRAHLEILFDLSLDELAAKHGFTNFVELHRAWQKTLDTSELNKKFFREVANWYYWAVDNVTFPPGAGGDPETRNAVSVIRLITRLIFVWFIKEKGLVPPELFDKRALDRLLKWNDARGSTYYKAILQNLFFATLNQEMNSPGKEDRRVFRKGAQHYNITNLYRYRAYFRDPDWALALFAVIPFLNGGLFECLDKPGTDDMVHPVRVDGFSDRLDSELSVPDWLFFGAGQEVDLNAVYDTKNKRYKVRGLIPIFDSYKFTVTENTPLEEEVALDPELLGKVFENLLAAYNPETGVTARKQTGSFYTPREIVDYMVDESLIAYLTAKLASSDVGNAGDLEAHLRHLFAYTDEAHRFTDAEVGRLIAAINHVRILDPACGSGAFPMGILHKLVFILGKLDPGNERWKEKQIAKVVEITDPLLRERARADIEQAFAGNELDYGRKLYLIENCIYGVDIQPIAVQIAKLRCFISLVAEQRAEDAAPNRGILPLPNLETNFVAANTLLGIGRPQQLVLHNPEIDEKEEQLAKIRRAHFTARTPKTKAKYREIDKALRQEIADLLERDGLTRKTTQRLAFWDPYDQNASADFFDPDWMFGVKDGFDVVLGNPPYVDAHTMVRLGMDYRDRVTQAYSTAVGPWDLYIPFWERGMTLTVKSGITTFITPNKWLTVAYGKQLRSLALDLLVKLIDYSSFRAFEDTGVFPVVAFMQSDARHDVILKRVISGHVFASTSRFSRSVLAGLEHWGVLLSTRADLALRLLDSCRPLASFCSVEEAFSVGQAYELKPFIKEATQLKTDVFRLLNTGTIDAYTALWGTKVTSYLKLKFLRPVIAREEMRRHFGRRYLQANCSKIVISGIRHFEAFWDRNGEYVAGISTVILRDFSRSVQPAFLLGVLNSKIIKFYLRECYGSLSMDGGINFTRTNVSTIPIPDTTELEQSQIGAISERISKLRNADPTADVSVLETEIDQLVFRLYGLTPDEIKIVEEGVR